MAGYHILLVEDQADVRRMLRSGLESLGSDYTIIDVPSGEEAMLLSTRQPIDLLVADVRLAGITGLELMQKIKVSNPFLKVVLLTGITEPKVREQVSQAGADAFFFKPIEIDTFLEAVVRVLGSESKSIAAAKLQPGEMIEPAQLQGLSDLMSQILADLNLIGALLLNDHGQVLAQKGEFPGIANLSSMIPVLLMALNASTKVSYALGRDDPGCLIWLRGVKHDAYMANVGPSAVLIVLNAADIKERDRARLVLSLPEAADTLKEYLSSPVELPEKSPIESKSKKQDEPPPKVAPADGEDLADLESLLQQAKKKKMHTKELEAFWDTATDQPAPGTAIGSDALTYDQAREMGIAPEEET